MPDYGLPPAATGGYGGGGQQSPLSLYSMLYLPPARGQAPAGQSGYGGPPQQPQVFQQRSPQQVPWWAQMFWNNPAKSQDPEKKDDTQQQQKQAMQMGQLGLQMLQPRPPTHTGPYPWI